MGDHGEIKEYLYLLIKMSQGKIHFVKDSVRVLLTTQENNRTGESYFFKAFPTLFLRICSERRKIYAKSLDKAFESMNLWKLRAKEETLKLGGLR